MTLTQDETNWKRASVRASLTMTKPGSPRLQVGYEGGDDTRWKTQLDFLKPTFSSAIETFPGRVMVWGASLGKRDECFLIALDDATGEVAYTVPFPQPTANQINFFLWNGDFLLVGFGGGLWAIDPATGEKAWTLGSTGTGRTIDSSQMGQ
jgi:outer membrane protein assembly factor BamB